MAELFLQSVDSYDEAYAIADQMAVELQHQGLTKTHSIDVRRVNSNLYSIYLIVEDD